MKENEVSGLYLDMSDVAESVGECWWVYLEMRENDKVDMK